MLQIKVRHVPRCNTAEGWLSEIIPLIEGEVGIETDTYKWKIGKIKVGGNNSLTPWNELKYMGSISEYTIGNLVSIDNNGNIVDSGTKVSDLEPALPITPSDPEIKYLNGNKQWTPIVIGSGGYYGVSGQTVLEASQWVDNVYNINITQLGNYDAIFLTPSALADKTALESANIIISTNGSTVIFTAEISPTVDISLEYFISRGRANE